MRIFPVLFALIICLQAGSACAQDNSDAPAPPAPPPTDEYNSVPPGILMSGAIAIPDSPADSAQSDDDDVMTMDDLISAYNKGQYDLVAKHVVPVANGNYPQAQELLGIMYHKGQGVTEDSQTAIEWLNKAAEAGRPLAQHYLATMTYSGEGTPKDPVKALMWLDIAIVHYQDGAQKTRAIADRDNISQQLSRRDRARAFELARDWLKKRDEGALLEQTPPP